MTKKLLFIILPLIALLSYSCQNKKNTQVPASDKSGVIFDTDLGSDIDDVFALQMILNYAHQGKYDLLGIAISKDFPRVIDYVDGYCRLNGFDEVPLGYAYNGSDLGFNRECGKYVCATLDTMIDGKKLLPVKRTIADSIPEGYKMMRKALANRADSSVVIITVGFATNLSRLLNSQPDEFSELNGIDLIKKKVKLLSIMSGTYNDDTFNNPEWNVLQDLKAAQNVYNNWPTEVIASGSEVGVRILYPHESVLNDYPGGEKYPLCVSYKSYEQMPYDRPCWDLTSVLYAIEPENSHLNISPKGKITIDEKGYSRFTSSQEGKHRFLMIDNDSVAAVVNKLVEVSTNIPQNH